MITYGVEGLSTVAILQRSKMCIFFDFSCWFYRRFISLSWWYIHMFLFGGYNKRTKIDRVYCLGLHHFTNENTICLCRKGIYELMVDTSFAKKKRSHFGLFCHKGFTVLRHLWRFREYLWREGSHPESPLFIGLPAQMWRVNPRFLLYTHTRKKINKERKQQYG